MTVDKAALLDAIAQGGQRAGDAYKQSQQALAAQQAEAVRMTLSGSLAGAAPSEAQTELSGIVSAPYQRRIAQSTSNEAIDRSYFEKLGANAGVFADQAQSLIPALEASAARKASGSGSGRKPTQLELRGDYEAAARELGGSDPWWVTARRLAREDGISTKDAELWFQPSQEYTQRGLEGIKLNSKAPFAGPVASRADTPAKFAKRIRERVSDPAEQRYLMDQYEAMYEKRFPGVQAKLSAKKKPLQNPKLRRRFKVK